MKSALLLTVAVVLTSGAANAQSPSSTPSNPPKADVFHQDTLKMLKTFSAKSLIDPALKSQLPTTVLLRKELDLLFDTDGCPLNQDYRQRIKTALKDEATGKETSIPKDLSNLISQKILDSKVQPFPDTSANAVLHSVTVVDGETERQLSLPGAETYNTKTASDYLDTEMSDFAFVSDCSGYVNAALRAGASIPGSKIQGVLESAASQTKSTMVMRAHVFSPASAAMDWDIGGAKMSARQRTDILYAIVAEVFNDHRSNGKKPADTYPITAWRKVDMLWSSNKGESAVSGKASLTGGANVGFGVATMEASSSMGAQLSKQIKFSAFNTYILDFSKLKPVQRSYGDLKTLLRERLAMVMPNSTVRVNDRFDMTFPDIPAKACGLVWKASTASNSTPGTLATEATAAGCKVSFTAATELPAGTFLTAKATLAETELSFSFQTARTPSP